MEISLSELCKELDARGFPTTLEGEDRRIRAVNTITDAGEDELSFLSNPKYLAALATTRAAAVVVKEDVAVPPAVSALRCADPYGAVTVAIITIHGYREHPRWGTGEEARIHETATIGEGANIAHDVTIAAGARIGKNCTIYPGCYVGDDSVLGDGCTLYPNVVIYDGCRLGARCTIHAGTVIGEDGLGYAPVRGKWFKIPQVGSVVIGDDVEIGANCSIDRATLGTTTIGSGTKFGNGNVIGHGTRIGEDCLLVGLVGLAGSADVGDGVTIAGMVGVTGHVRIGDRSTLAAKSGVASDIPAGATYFGYPAEPMGESLRAHASLGKLPEMRKRLRELERKVEEMAARL